MNIIAKLKEIAPVQSGETERGFWYRGGMVVESLDGNNRLMFFVVNGKTSTDALQQIPPSSTIRFDIGIESRQFNGKWYTDVRAYNIEVLTASRS